MFSRFYTLLLSVVAVSASWAAFGAVGGSAVSAILATLAVRFGAGKSRWSRWLWIVTPAIWLVAMAGLLLPAIHEARHAALDAWCKNNLKQIGLAVQTYWDCHGCYPPVCTYDTTGRPMHSWRLFIKPFLDASATYLWRDFNEPWDGPKNRRLLADRQHVYQCPLDETAWAPHSTKTSYLAVVGRRAVRRPGKSERSMSRDLDARAADVFLVVEVANSGVQWTEPKDIRFDDLPASRSLIAKSPHLRGNGYFSHPTPAANAVLVDRDMVFLIPWDATSGVLAGLLRCDDPRDKQKRDKNKDKYDGFADLYLEKPRLNLSHCIGLPVWIVAIGLLFYRIARLRSTT